MSIESDKMFLRAMWTWFTLTCVHCARIAWYMGIILFVVATVVLTVFRYWLPALSERKVEIETFVSQQIGQQVTIGTMSADWRGLYPSLHVRDLVLHSDDGKEEKLRLEELGLMLDIVPLLQGRFVFRQVTLEKPNIEIIRKPDGTIRVGRIPTLKKREGSNNRNIFDIMFLQQFVVIENGVIEWRDEMLGEAPLLLTEINIGMRNSKRRHVFEGTLTLPGDTPRAVVLNAELEGNPMRDNDWDGVVNTRVSQVDISELPGVMTSALGISDLKGHLSVDLNTGWMDGAIDSAHGSIEAGDLTIPLGEIGDPVSVESLRAQLSIVNQDKTWQLRLVDTWLAFQGEPWSAGTVRFLYQEDESSMHLERAELEKLRPVLDSLTSENKIVQLVKDLYPTGLASDTRLVLHGPLGKKPRDFLYEMNVTQASVNAHKLYPALTGITGMIRVNKSGGLVDATANNATMTLGKVFSKPVGIDRIKAKVTWEKGEAHWHIRNDDMFLVNEDAEVTAQFHARVPLDKSQQPDLELSAQLHNGNLAQAYQYFPVRLLSDGMNRWLAQTRFRGRANHLKLEYKGLVKGFPIKGAEQFDVLANLGSASMNFMPDWPRVTGIDGDLVVSRTDLTLTGDANDLYGQRVSGAVVHLEHLDQPGKQVINVTTGLQGDTERVVEFLRTGPLFSDLDLQKLDIAGSGRGAMQLDVSIPLGQPENNTVKGSYSLKDAGLQLPNTTWMTGLNGQLSFSGKSLSATGVTGQYLGGPIKLDIVTMKQGRPPVIEVRAGGKVQVSELTPVLGDWITAGLQGSTSWQGIMHFGAGDPALHVTSDLVGMTTRFPAPLGKPAEQVLNIEMDAIFPAGRSTQVAFKAGDGLFGNLSFPTADQQDLPEISGCITIGPRRAECPSPAGLDLAVIQPTLETTPWLDYLASGEEGDGEWPDFMTRVSAQVDQMVVSGVDMGRVALKLRRQPDGYMRGWVDGSKVSGNAGVLWRADRQHFDIRLDRLTWDKATPGYAVSTGKPDPKTFPAIDARIDDLKFHGMQLGSMTLKGKPTDLGWRLDSMQLDRPDMKVSMNGRWRGSLQNHVSSFDVDFASTDMLATLTALDVNSEMDTNEFNTTGYLSWADTPFDFDFSILNGVLDIRAGKGSLNSVEVGAGRLLGAMNVDTLVRRLSLDFSDLFEEGFPFDKIEANMEIKMGQANVTQLIMPGPSATIRMQGRLGLVEEDVDMKMAISPALGGNLAVAGFALGGPVGGVATYLAQKAIQSQMNKTVNYRYHVRGSWQDPVVDKIAAPPPEVEQESEEALVSGE